MIAYAESNFVLEVALGQEQAADAQAIIELAENSVIELGLPSFSIAEPFGTIERRGRDRGRLYRGLGEQLREMSRSLPHQEAVNLLQPLLASLVGVKSTEEGLILQTIARLLKCCRIIHLDSDIFARVLELRTSTDLSFSDLVILSTVLHDLESRPLHEQKWFISRNWRHFRDSSVIAELHRFGCRYCESFQEGLTEILAARKES